MNDLHEHVCVCVFNLFPSLDSNYHEDHVVFCLAPQYAATPQEGLICCKHSISSPKDREKREQKLTTTKATQRPPQS